jgi:hypothetical protein
MTKSQVLEEIRLMPSVERLEVIEFTLRLIREEMTKVAMDQKVQKLSLVDASEIMRSYYAEESELTEFSDMCQEDFCEYEEYA